MTRTRSRIQSDQQLAMFFFITCAIAWPIAFFFSVNEELLRANHSPPVVTLIIYLPKFAFTKNPETYKQISRK